MHEGKAGMEVLPFTIRYKSKSGVSRFDSAASRPPLLRNWLCGRGLPVTIYPPWSFASWAGPCTVLSRPHPIVLIVLQSITQSIRIDGPRAS